MKTFAPNGSDTATMVATTASASVSIDAHSNSVRVVNTGAAMAFLRFGATSATATTADMPIASGATETFTKGSADKVAAITASGTATLYFTSGEGM